MTTLKRLIRMVKTINMFMISFVVAFSVMTIICCKNNEAKAATNEIRISGENLSDSFYADLNNDGIQECIGMKASMADEVYVKNYQITMDGNVIFREHDRVSQFETSCIELKNGMQVLRITGCGDSGCTTLDGIYMYNTKTNKLEPMIQLDSAENATDAYSVYGESIKVNSKGIEVKYSSQFDAVGLVEYIVKYNVKGNKLVRSKDTVSILKGKKYKSQKSIDFLKSPTSNKVAFKINKGQSVSLKKVCLNKKTYYLMFKNGNKTGWIKAKKKDIFNGVEFFW